MPRSRDPQKLQLLLQATTRLVARTGFAGLKMAEVAAEAGLATGTVYIYYKNKIDLVNAAYLSTQEEIAQAILKPEIEAETFYETFEARWQAYFRFCFAQPDKMLFVEQFRYSGLVSDQTIARAEELFTPYDQFLTKGQKQGFLRKMDLGILKAQIRGATHETIKWMVQQNKALTEDFLDLCFDLAWGSVRK